MNSRSNLMRKAAFSSLAWAVLQAVFGIGFVSQSNFIGLVSLLASVLAFKDFQQMSEVSKAMRSEEQANAEKDN